MYNPTSLHEVIVYAEKKSGMAGATAYKGILSYGSKSRIKSQRFFAISEDLPTITEITDKQEKIRDFINI